MKGYKQVMSMMEQHLGGSKKLYEETSKSSPEYKGWVLLCLMVDEYCLLFVYMSTLCLMCLLFRGEGEDKAGIERDERIGREGRIGRKRRGIVKCIMPQLHLHVVQWQRRWWGRTRGNKRIGRKKRGKWGVLCLGFICMLFRGEKEDKGGIRRRGRIEREEGDT